MFMVSNLTQVRQTELLSFMHDQKEDFWMKVYIPNIRYFKTKYSSGYKHFLYIIRDVSLCCRLVQLIFMFSNNIDLLIRKMHIKQNC